MRITIVLGVICFGLLVVRQTIDALSLGLIGLFSVALLAALFMRTYEVRWNVCMNRIQWLLLWRVADKDVRFSVRFAHFQRRVLRLSYMLRETTEAQGEASEVLPHRQPYYQVCQSILQALPRLTEVDMLCSREATLSAWEKMFGIEEESFVQAEHCWQLIKLWKHEVKRSIPRLLTQYPALASDEEFQQLRREAEWAPQMNEMYWLNDFRFLQYQSLYDRMKAFEERGRAGVIGKEKASINVDVTLRRQRLGVHWERPRWW